MSTVTVKDLTQGREKRAVPLVFADGIPQGRDQLAYLGVFQEYIPQSIIHPSAVKQALVMMVGAAAEISGTDGDEQLDSPYGCTCSHSSTCCTANDNCECVSEHGNFYDDQGRLQLDALPTRHVLVECSEVCACQIGSDKELEGHTHCANSVVKRGIRLALEVRLTPERGLGLFSSVPIPRGTFICEFAGEILSDAETTMRWSKYEAEGVVGNYILCMRERLSSSQEPTRREVRTNIDPTLRGNVARFINHLCPPLTNVLILPIRCDVSLPNLPPGQPAPPRAAIFASRHIPAGEELGYDYSDASGDGPSNDGGDKDGHDWDEEMKMTNDANVQACSDGKTPKPCHCLSPQCRGHLPTLSL